MRDGQCPTGSSVAWHLSRHIAAHIAAKITQHAARCRAAPDPMRTQLKWGVSCNVKACLVRPTRMPHIEAKAKVQSSDWASDLFNTIVVCIVGDCLDVLAPQNN